MIFAVLTWARQEFNADVDELEEGVLGAPWSLQRCVALLAETDLGFHKNFTRLSHR